MKNSSKIAMIFVVSSLVLLFVGVWGLGEIDRVLASHEREIKYRNLNLELEKIKSNFYSLGVKDKKYLLSRSNAESLDEIEELKVLPLLVERVKKDISNQDSKAYFVFLENMVKKRIRQIREKIAYKSDVSRSQNDLDLIYDRDEKTRKEIDSLINNILLSEKSDLHQVNYSKNDKNVFYFILFVAILINLSLLYAARFFLRSKLNQVLYNLLDALTSISKGNWQTHIQCQEKGVIGEVIREFNQMIEKKMLSDKELFKTTNTLTSVIECSPIGIIVLNHLEEVIVCNPSAEMLLGRRAVEIKSKLFKSINKGTEEILDRVLNLKNEYLSRANFEYSFNGENNKKFELSITSTSIGLNGDSLLLLLIEDITSKVEKSKELENILKREVHLNEMLEKIIYATISIEEDTSVAQDATAKTLPRIVEMARTSIGADYAALGMGTSQEKEFDPWIFSGVDEKILTQIGRAPKAIGLLGLVARRGQSIRIPDINKHHLFHGLPAPHPSMGALLGIPISFEGKSLGNLYLAKRPEKGPFNDYEQKVIELFAAYCAVVIQKSKLYEELDEDKEMFSLLADISALMAFSTNEKTLLKEVGKILYEKWNKNIELFLYNEQEEDYSLEVQFPESNGESFFTLEMIRPTRRSLKVQSIDNRKGAISPIVTRGKFYGIVCFYDKNKALGFKDLQLIEIVSGRIGLAIESCRLFVEANISSKTRQDIVAMVSHDLKNPLNSIMLNIDLLHKKVEGLSGSDEGFLKYTRNIKKLTDQMNQIVSTLLDASELEAGKIMIHPEKCHPEELVSEVVELCSSLAMTKDIKINYEVDKKTVDFFCDIKRIQRTLSNLIHNAIKFTPKHGFIKIEVRPIDQGVLFSIKDNGIGISEEIRPHVFDRFWSGNSKDHGSGLGLYIAKGIVEEHGGKIWFESEEAKGTTFYFALPITPQKSFDMNQNLPNFPSSDPILYS